MRPYESDDGRAFTSLFLGAKSELAMSMALVPDILTMPIVGIDDCHSNKKCKDIIL